MSPTRTSSGRGPGSDGSDTRAAPWVILRQLVVFACVGGAFNVFYGALYVVLREQVSAQPANAIALVLSTIAGTWGHRRLTFGVRGRQRTVSHQVLGLALLGFSLAVTAGSLWLLDANVAAPSKRQELAVLVAANLGAGLVRFTAFRVAMVPQTTQRQQAEDSPRVSGPRGSQSRLSESNRRPDRDE